eukprot:jgi/Ulvmu1/3642/UM017_0056.1
MHLARGNHMHARASTCAGRSMRDRQQNICPTSGFILGQSCVLWVRKVVPAAWCDLTSVAYVLSHAGVVTSLCFTTFNTSSTGTCGDAVGGRCFSHFQVYPSTAMVRRC